MDFEDTSQVCPICNKSGHMSDAVKPLYGHQVCKKCANGFTNRREGAFLIDIFLWYLSMTIFGLFVDLPQSESSTLYISLIFWIIFFLKDGFSGYSPGKAIFGIQTFHEPSRKPAGFLASFKRNVIMIIPVIILFLVIDIKKGYRVGDSWAETKVIWKKHKDKAPFELKNSPDDG